MQNIYKDQQALDFLVHFFTDLSQYVSYSLMWSEWLGKVRGLKSEDTPPRQKYGHRGFGYKVCAGFKKVIA
ncbi:hypothetical protein GCM10009426_36370 [Rheinheimera tangshanensis]|nr:hypothetical protein GCM10010920_09160 [Rheinheimera tangshanensis]